MIEDAVPLEEPNASGSLPSWAIFAILGPILPLICTVLVIMALHRYALLDQEVDRTYQERLHLIQLCDQVLGAESEQRGYLVSGKPAFLASHLAAQARVEHTLQTLASDVAGDSEALARLDVLSQQVRLELGELASTLQVEQRLGPAAARDRVEAGEERNYVDLIRAQVEASTDAAAARLSSHQNQAADTLGLLNLLVIAAFIAFVGLVAIAIRRERQSRSQRARLLAELRDAAARQQAIFDSAFDAIVTLSPRGAVETANAAGLRLFGYERDELVGKDFSRVVDMGADSRKAYLRRHASKAAIAAGAIQHLTGRRKDGVTFPIDTALGAMPMPDGLHVVVVARDASESRRVEIAKDEFISTVSHELRTPLTSIAGSLGLLKAGAAGRLPERATRLVQIADANSARLVRLINDILDIEKIQSGQATMSLETLDLNALARASIETMSGFADERGVVLELKLSKSSVLVSGDEDRLIQVLSNLLSNSIKFSLAKSKVQVEVSRHGGLGRISVIDQGPGIPESFKPKIFSKFAQAPGSNGDRRGTGLGLAIAHEIVGRHGGDLSFRSKEGEGAVFCVDLPLRDEDWAPDQQDLGMNKILVCEDDVLAAEDMREELGKHGFVVSLAHTAGEARRLLDAESFAALLLDMKLPDFDGLALIRSLRETESISRLPVIMVSGAERGREEARNLGVADWIEKPIDMGHLLQVLQQVLGASQYPRLRILHVDDDPDIIELAKSLLCMVGEVAPAASLAAARSALRLQTWDVVILDLSLPDGSGAELLQDLPRGEGETPAVIVYTAQDVEQALAEQVDAVLTKSRANFASLSRAIVRAVYSRRVVG